MALNVVVRETGIETGVAFGVGTLINTFLSDEHVTHENWMRSVVEIVGALVANGLATSAYLDYAKNSGDPELLKLVPYVITLTAVQPRLLAKIHGLSNITSAKWSHIVSPAPGTPVESKSPAATANQTRVVNTKPSVWRK